MDAGADQSMNVEKKSSFLPLFKKTSACTTVGSGSEAGPQPAAQSAQPLIPVLDRTANTEAMILGYIAEHSLPLSLADSLTKLVQETSRDPKSLNSLALSKQTAWNKMNFYLGKTCTEVVV